MSSMRFRGQQAAPAEHGSDDDEDTQPKQQMHRNGDPDQRFDALNMPWLRQFPYMPARLRQLLSSPQIDISSRICRDVVIRLPIKDAGKTEVMAIASHFGHAEYISNASRGSGSTDRDKMLRSFGASTAAPPSSSTGSTEGSTTTAHVYMSPTPEDGDRYCHYVQFTEGRDALRCVMQLNGIVLDPALHRRAMTTLQEMMPEAGSNEEGDEESKLWDDLRQAIHDGEVARNELQCADPGAEVIVITCDFFRNALRPNHGLNDARLDLLAAQVPGGSASAGGRSASGWTSWVPGLRQSVVPKTLKKPIQAAGGPNPLKAHQYNLYASSVILHEWHQQHQYSLANDGGDEGSTQEDAEGHMVRPEHSLISFEDLMFVTNYFTAFFAHDITRLSPPHVADTADYQHVHARLMTLHPSVHSVLPLAITHKAIKAAGYDVELALSWFDVAQSEDDLWTGQHFHQGLSSKTQNKGRKGNKKPMVALPINGSRKGLTLTDPLVLLVVVPAAVLVGLLWFVLA